jgi:Na+(H+)/acetate symporter ActP
MLLAFNPPTFLVTSILWAFGLLSTTATPGILLGVWWKQANKYALLVSSTICGFLYILISPHVFKGFVLGKGLTAALGMSEALLTVPLSFALFIVLSVTFNKMGWAPSQEEKAVLDRIHGWNDYDENRYNGRVWPWVTVAVCLVICWWALQPWK